jgi:putative hydrolase of the HAD superfamily
LAIHHWQRFARGEVSFEGQRRERVREFLNVELGDDEADAAFEPYWREYERSWKLFPDVLEFLEQTSHLPRVIVTNGERPQQMRKIEATGLSKHFVAVVTPTDCGHWKPHVEIFAAALRLVGVPPESCMMIGDDIDRDIAPARSLGMHSFHVDRSKNQGLTMVVMAPARSIESGSPTAPAQLRTLDRANSSR